MKRLVVLLFVVSVLPGSSKAPKTGDGDAWKDSHSSSTRSRFVIPEHLSFLAYKRRFLSSYNLFGLFSTICRVAVIAP